MSNYVSINIQQCNPASAICHNSIDRGGISYLVSSPNTITTHYHELTEFQANTTQAKEDVYQYFPLRVSEINADYKAHNNNRNIRKGTQLYHEAVVSFGRETFEQNNQSDILESLEKFCNNFEQKYKVKVLMSSLHLDEGHKDENDKIQHNYHAHILIENYSFETHKTGMRTIDYRKLQTELATEFQHLGFERGDPERKAQRLEHKQYREAMEQKKELVQEIYNEHYEPLEKNYEQLKTQIQPLVNQAFTIAKEQNKEIKTYEDVSTILEEQLTKLTRDYKQARENLKASGIAKQVDYQSLKKSFEQTQEQIKVEISTIKKQQEVVGKKLYKRELQEENPKMSKFIALPDPEHSNRFVIQAPLTSETTINKLLETLQETAYKIQEIQTPKYVEKIIEKPVIKEVEKIVEKEVIKEIPKYIDKIIEIEKRVEKPIIVNIDENQQLKASLTKATLNAIEQTSKIRALESKIDQLESTTNSQKIDLEHQKNDIIEIHNENFALKIENRSLKNAIERFLDLSTVKGITEGVKTLLERFNLATTAIKMTFSKNQELTQENNSLKNQLTAQQEKEQIQNIEQIEIELQQPSRRRR